VIAEMEEMAAMEQALEDSPVEAPLSSEIDAKIACKGTCDAYVEKIDTLKADLKEAKDLTNEMADSLATIDPNMENGEEGKALLRKMYKLSDRSAEDSSPIMPETPELCIDLVAGKVLQIETLTEDMDLAVDFRDFFAEVYCSAFVNSLVTMQDGLSQIFPGGFDLAIEQELQRAYGPFEIEQLDAFEISAMTQYYTAIDDGSFEFDESNVLPEVEPLEGAMNLCNESVVNEAAKAKQDRLDYLDDFNFLQYLKSL